MGKEDIYRNNSNLEKAVERHISKLHSRDREDVRSYFEDLTSNGISIKRVHKIASILSKIASRTKNPFAEMEKQDVKRYCIWLERSEYSDWSKHDHRIILRAYMRWLGKGEAVDWVKAREPKNGTMPEEIMVEEEIKELSSATYTSRDRAFVLALYESGCRIGEFLPLRIKHLSFDKFGVAFRVTGKTGDRRIRLVASTLPLQRWLEEHPDRNDPDAYLWCQIPGKYHPAEKVKQKHLSYGFVCRLLNEIAKKAEVKKKVNPHAFRHSRATFMARHLKEPEMREFFGWDKDSKMPSTYVHLSGRDVDSSVLSIYGIKEVEESQDSKLKAFDCPRCQEPNDSTRLYCGRCGLPFTEEVIKEERMESVMVDFIRLLSERVPEAKGIFQEIASKQD